MKNLYFFLILFPYVANVNSQAINSQTIDSLRQVLNQKESDTTKVKLLAQYSFHVVFTNPVEALSFAQEGILLANSLDYQKGRLLCNLSLGFTKWIQSNYTESTEIFLQSLKEAEAMNDLSSIKQALDGLISSYRDHGNHREALKYSFKSMKLFPNSSYSKIGTGSVYNAMKMPDSALYYLLPIDKRFGRAFYGFSLFETGKAFHQKKDFGQALTYYKNSIDTLKKSTNIKDLALAHNGVAQLYSEIGKLDSCIYFAKKGLEISEKLSYKKGVLESYLLISGALESSDLSEALSYYKQAMVIKDDIYNTLNQTRAISARFDNQIQMIELEKQQLNSDNRTRKIIIYFILMVSIIVIILLYRNIRIKQKAKNKIENAYGELKATQSQLIQSEKMASLGELTAGIAHEIQNPLNFVNNFSELSEEMVEELAEEIKDNSNEIVTEIMTDLKQNLNKITNHGKRASSIVKGMLEHSRTTSGNKELTDINALAGEFLRLSYHGLRAKDKTFNVDFKTDFDTTLPKVKVIAQDLGRVILNLINNAFYACAERSRSTSDKNYKPLVTASTSFYKSSSGDLGSSPLGDRGVGAGVKITIKDNGSGIPENIKEKIFQPFFTTKPTGSGTGLGLSMSYDIITKGHGGELTVVSKKGEFTEFTIVLPIKY